MSFTKRNSKIVGNPIDAMRQSMELDSELRKYFYTDSRFTKTLRDHICKNVNKTVIELPEGCSLYYPRGQGPVSIGETKCYGTQYKGNEPYECDFFDMEISVLYDSLDDGEDQYHSKKYTLRVPIALEDNCSDEEFQLRFDKWVAEERIKMLEKKKKEDMKLLAILAKCYPDEVQLLK